jgi:hypothetical protein
MVEGPGALLQSINFSSGNRRDRNDTVGEFVLRENRTRMTRIELGGFRCLKLL